MVGKSPSKTGGSVVDAGVEVGLFEASSIVTRFVGAAVFLGVMLLESGAWYWI